MTVAEILIIAFWIALCWFVLYQNKLNRETKTSINDLRNALRNDLRNTVDTLYKTAIENEEDKCKIYKRLADLEEREKNG